MQDGISTQENEMGIQNPHIHAQVNFCANFDLKIKERIEVHERKAIKNLIVFVRRCIDVITFLKIISFEGEVSQELFKKMIKNIEKAGFLKELANTKY